MARKAQPQSGVGGRGLGMELRRHREKAHLTLEKTGAVLGWSASTLSRLERGLRMETSPDEVSALLAAMDVVGADRDRVMRMAYGQAGLGWWENTNANMTDQARTYLGFESRARRIVDVEPLLVPGLLQTPEYMHALMIGFDVDRSQITGRIARRLARQELLNRWDPLDLVFVVCELSLRQPIGGPGVMARQLWHMAEQARRPHVSVRVISARMAAHPALLGGFVVLEFDDQPQVVYVEGRRSGMFPEHPAEVAEYKLAAERSADLALAEAESLQLLLAIARDMERSG